MSTAQRILIGGGLALAALGMLYGLHYAVFVEHQTLDAMGGSFAQGFANAAKRKMPAAHQAMDGYASAKYAYVRQVDVHSHWVGLAMVMILLGVAFDWVALTDRVRTLVAASLATGSFVFPLGVILQTMTQGSTFSKALAILGSALVTIALAAVVLGFSRNATAAEH